MHLKLTISQLSLAHSAKVKTDMREKNENSWSPWSQSGGWKGRTIEERICGMEKMRFEHGVEERRSNG